MQKLAVSIWWTVSIPAYGASSGLLLQTTVPAADVIEQNREHSQIIPGNNDNLT